MSETATPAFRETAGLARWIVRLLYLQAALAAVAIWSGWLELKLIERFAAGDFGSEAEAMVIADASDRRQQIVAIAQAAIFIANGIAILIWIYRAHVNVRALGAEPTIKPGWAVGWFFVPFATLVMPQTAMRELWAASASPSHWKAADAPGWWLNGWWALWLGSNILTNVGFRLYLQAEDLETLRISSLFYLGGDVLTIPLCLVFAGLLGRIEAMQQGQPQRAQ